ncbi:MAG: LamG domain-containing protein [Candidatus Micrarchaeota archaeon]|nr:LamG domain-containing protein [Candidatus Micrarchaeota archaeon]
MAILKKTRLQSAMEYLMTYGWAILAIAIVMVSLYSLGIFNTGNLQPTATTGSCQVVRTAAQTSLAGQCNNLIPKYVGRVGYSSLITVGTPMPFGGNFTYVIWIKYLSNKTVSQWPTILGASAGQGSHEWSALRTSNWGASVFLEYGKYPTCDGTSYTNAGGVSISDGKWHQAVGTYNGSALVLYVDGIKQNSASQSGLCPGSTPYYVGYGYNGSISNVQVYNTSLDSAAVKALYQEGIGGVPIDVKHLVGWWPLNGNVNDYSGNNNQGTPTNVNWNANWQSGYAAPSS